MTLLLILVFLVCSILCIKTYFAVIDNVSESEIDINDLKKISRSHVIGECSGFRGENVSA